MTQDAEGTPAVEETLRIGGKDVPIHSTTIPQAELRFFGDNPRVYSILRSEGNEPNQEDIERKLLEMDHVKELIHDIKSNGGLTDPVVVRAVTLEVLEGNSRLAAYRALAKSDPIKWGRMKVRVLPEDIDEALIFALLGQYHIKGKKDWAPFEQAGFLYRRSLVHGADIPKLAQEVGLSRSKVEHLISVYRFMQEKSETDATRWSYYDEYLKSPPVKKARNKHPGLDDLVVQKIKSGEIFRAVDVRDRLPLICGATKTLQKFVAGTLDFEEAHEHAVEGGADNAPYKKLAKFRQWLAQTEVEASLGRAQGETRNKIDFELDKLASRIEAVRARLKKSATKN